MKPIQWIIAVVVLVLMVFAVTFIMNFLGENTPPPGGPPPTPQGEDTFLTFWETSYPGVTQFHDQEFNHTGGDHDFLFQNTTDENVTVTLSHLSCHCASVTLFLASEEWRMNLARMTASKMAQSAQFALNPWLVFGFAGPPDPVLSDVAAKIEAVGRFDPDKDKDMTFTIPPRAVGWFRVGWPGDKNGTNTYTATIGNKTANKQGTAVDLKTAVRWANPAYVAYPIYYVGEFPASELQKQPKIENVYVYSTPRLTLQPKEATLVSKLKMEESPIIVGEPEYLMPPYTWLYRPTKGQAPPTGQDVFVPERILRLYRIPVTFQERSPDKKRPLPFGLFRMRVRVTFADENVDPVVCFMHGTVRGDVRVGGSGQLNFGLTSKKHRAATIMK